MVNRRSLLFSFARQESGLTSLSQSTTYIFHFICGYTHIHTYPTQLAITSHLCISPTSLWLCLFSYILAHELYILHSSRQTTGASKLNFLNNILSSSPRYFYRVYAQDMSIRRASSYASTSQYIGHPHSRYSLRFKL